LRTVFLGTSRFAVAVLERLAGGAHRPALVLTRPDRPSGRGRRLVPPPVVEAACALGIELEQPERVNDAAVLERIGQAVPQAVVVCAFGELIREPLLSACPLLNVHPSLLPRWRGAAPVERAIMAGDAQTGVSIMRLTAGLDSGPVGLAQAEPIGPLDTYGSLVGRLQELCSGPGKLTQALGVTLSHNDSDLYTGPVQIHPRPGSRWRDPSIEVGRRIGAGVHAIGARLERGRRRLGVLRARAASDGPPLGALADVEGRLLYGTRAGRSSCWRSSPGGQRWRPLHTSVDMPSQRTRLCHAVLRRVFSAARTRTLRYERSARDLDARRPGAGDAPRPTGRWRRGSSTTPIRRLAQRPVDRLDAPLRAALWLGLYELLYLDGAPDQPRWWRMRWRLAKTAGNGHGLVNAVLRRATRALCCWCSSTTSPRRGRCSTTRIPCGSPGSGGTSWEPTRRGRCWHSTTSLRSWRCG
jgi:methionyl-tRNA formyltransferase